MKAIGKFLSIRLTNTGVFESKTGPMACYLAAIVVLILGFRKLPAVADTEKDMLFGLLLIVGVSLLLVVLGMVVHIAAFLKQEHSKPGNK